MKRLPLSLEPEAKADLLEAYEWYEKQRAGLGSELIECVDDALERISRQLNSMLRDITAFDKR